MKHSVPLLILSWALVCLAVVFGGLAVTLAPGETTWAWPVPGGSRTLGGFTSSVALVTAVLAVVALVPAVTLAKHGRRARPWAELVLYYALVFGVLWWVIGPGTPGLRHVILGGLLLMGAVVLKTTLRPTRPEAPPRRTWLAADILLVGAPVAAGLLLGTSPDGNAIGVSLLLYPLYGCLQLLVFLAVPADRLQVMGAGPRLSVLAGASLFGLIHWPNPVVMLLTAAAMAVWSFQYRRGRSLLELAVVMGLAATTVSQFLPDDLTRHMRVGPGYIRQETVLEAAGDPATSTHVPLADFLVRTYPATVGRAPMPAELSQWTVAMDQALRPVTAWHFFISREYDRLATRRGLPTAPPVDVPWTELDVDWQRRIDGLAAQGAHLPWDDYIAFLYGEVLQRTPGPTEGAAWTRDLNWSQRKRITEVLLDWRLIEGGDMPVRVTAADLNLIQ